MPNRDRYEEGIPSFIDLMTTDIDGARAFYSALFGWEFERNETDRPDNPYYMARRNGRAACGMSAQPPEQVAMGIPPMFNVYLTVDDIDASAARVEEAGGSVMAPPFDVMDAGRMAVVVDPVGAVVSLWQAKEHIGAEIVNEPGAFCWAELQTTDQDAAAGFYAELVGWDTATADMGPMGKMTMFRVAGQDIASAMDVPTPGIPPHWQAYFAVEDCDAACAQVAELGGQVLMPGMDAPPGRMATVQDPFGAVFSIIALANPAT